MKRMMTATGIALAISATILAGCGNRNALEPASGESLPVAPAGAEKTPDAEDLVEPETQAKPGRSDDPLTRSEERKDDPFDLPPAD